MGLEAFMRNIKAERDRRFRDPAFQRELALEKRKTIDAFNMMGEQTLDTAFQAIVRGPLLPMWRSLQTVIGAKKTPGKKETYTFGDVVLSILHENFWKTPGAVLKLGGVVLHAAGRTAKLGIRHLIAK